MKKLNLLFALPLAALLLAACASQPAAQPASAAQKVSTVPDWYENEVPPEDVFWGIGFAKLADDTTSVDRAGYRARRDVAAQLSAMVQAMLTDYTRTAGTLENSTSLQFIESVGRELINAQLNGAVINKRAHMEDGSWWIRVQFRKADAKKAITDIIDNEAAQFAEFKAQEALKMLDAQLANTQSKPQARGED